MTKKLFLILLCIVLLFFSFTSCSKKDTDKIEEPATVEETGKSADTVDLTPDSNKIVVWIDSDSPDHVTVNSFIQDNPDYEVDNTTCATNPFGTLERTIDLQRLGAAIASNEQPDLFLGYMTPNEAYYSNLFDPLTFYLTHDPEFNFETVEPNALKSTSFGDDVYFIPVNYSTQMLVWNKDLFESVGLDPDKPPKTWSEYLEYCERLVTYDSNGELKTVGSLGCSFADWYIWHIVASGEQYTDEKGLTFNFDTEAFNKTMEFSRSVLGHFGGLSKLPKGFGFYNGNVGMGSINASGAPLLPIWVDSKFEFGIGFLPKPDDMEEDFLPFVSGNLLAIPKKAVNPKGGWMFLKYMTTEAEYAKAVSQYNSRPNDCMLTYFIHIPTREKLYEEFGNVFTEKTWTNTRKRDEIIESANVPMYTLAVQSEFNMHLQPEFDKMMKDLISPKEMLQNAQSYVESAIKSFKERKVNEDWVLTESGELEPPKSE